MLNPFDPTPQQRQPAQPAEPIEAIEPAASVASEPTESEPVVAEPVVAEPVAAGAADEADDEVFEADAVLVGAVDQARAALESITPAATIGESLGYIVEGEHLLSQLFDCLMPGYPGWRWTVSLSRVDDDSQPQVLETELMPGDDALLAPEWVPWSDRLADSKLAEELAAADLADDDDSDDDNDDDDDSDDHDHDDSDDDDSDEADLHADDVTDDGIDVDEALAASDQNEGQAAETQAEADHGAPQPPVQSRGMQFSAEDDGQHQRD